MNDQPKSPAHDPQADEIKRKMEEVIDAIQPAIAALRELGYQPSLIADGESGVIRMTLEVHTIPK